MTDCCIFQQFRVLAVFYCHYFLVLLQYSVASVHLLIIFFAFQPLDFESKRTHNVVVEAVNKHVDPRFVDLGSFRDQTIVRVSVSDIDEPPIFQPAEGAIMEVQEDAKVGALVGIVTARDPDVKNKPVRYDIGSKANFIKKKNALCC